MATLILDLPEGLSCDEVRQTLALRLWAEHRLSMGQAAEMAGLGKEEFMRFAGSQGVPIFDYPADLEVEMRR